MYNVSDARQALIDALQDYVTENAGDGVVVTDFALTASTASLHGPVIATQYFTVNRGPLHSMLGLTEYQKEHFKSLNREEMLADANDGEED